ncbi:MAG TPA: rhomboid family intramembrane serine protease [Burkholderiales bacterium]|nr:rhomboid family intramembrane serine protease [Burkholderiales bacterium]
MFLPIGDEPNPPGAPVMTIALIVVNCAVFLLVTLPLSTQPVNPSDPLVLDYLRAVSSSLPPGTSEADILRHMRAYDLVVYRWGYRPDTPHLITLLTAMFLHGGFLHLFGNMLYLWIYGDNVEHRLGAPAYLFWYLITGIAATLLHAFLNAGSGIPLVGASGAISGVLGFYLVWFPHNRIKIWVFLFPIYLGVVHINAIVVLSVYLILDNLLPILVAGGQGGVAHGAHIGGFLAGMAAAAVLRRPLRA